MQTLIDTGNTIGITRPMDELNRIVIPMEIIRQHKLRTRVVRVYSLKDGVYMEFDKEMEE